MKYLDQVYIRLEDGLIFHPTQGKNSLLFNYYGSEEPPLTMVDIDQKTCGNIVLLKQLINKPVEYANEQPTYSVKVNNQIFDVEYEEMVEIFSVFRYKKEGNEYYESAMNKAKQIFDKLPTTDY